MRKATTNGFRPALETLEDRNLLAAQVMVMGQTLWITGDRNANFVTINDDGSGAAGGLTGTVDGVSFNALTAGTAITRIYMQMGRGNDFVQYNLNGDTNGATMRVDAFLFQGNDTFAFNAGTNGLFGGSTYFFGIRGEAGNDTLRATMDNSADFFNLGNTSSLGLRFMGGNGDDTISFQYSGDVDGLLNFYADGGNGRDTIGAIFNLYADPGNVPGRIWAQIHGGDDENVLGLRVFDFDPNTTDNIFALIDGGGERNTTVATANVLFQNFRRNSPIFILDQPVL